MHKYQLLSAAILAALSNQVIAEDAVLEEIPVKAANQQKSVLQLTKTNNTASRLGLTAKETPASVEVLDADTINKRGDISIREAVTRTTGLTDITNPGEGVAFSSRGFTGNNSVAQAEDGVRLATAAGTLTYPSDTWGYERIEVLRGPASVMFGDGSAGGLINSIRKQPSRETSLEALVGIGTRGAYRAAIGGTGAIGEIGAYRIDASTLGGNGYIDRGDYESKKIMSSLLFIPSDHLKISFTLDHSEESPTANFGSPTLNGNILYALRKANYNVADNKMAFIDTRARTKIEWDISPTLKLRNETYWFKSDREWRSLEEYTLNTASNTVDRATYLAIKHDQTQYGNRLEVSSIEPILGHANRWSAGWEIAHTDFRRSSNRGNTISGDSVPIFGFNPGEFQSSAAVLADYDSQVRQQAFSAENAWSASNRLKLLVGLRKDFINTSKTDLRGQPDTEKDFSPITWRVGSVFDLTANTSAYGQLSQGTDPIATLLGLNLANAAFDLTKSRQQELGIKHQLPNRKGEITLAIYHIAKDNIITRDPLTPSLSIQGGKQSSGGIELASTLLPVGDWRIDLNATVLNARYDELTEATGIDRSGKTPVNVPEKVANAWLYYQQPFWEAGIGTRYVGKRYANNANTVEVDSYAVVDASAAWRVDPKLTLRANLRNVTNKFYATNAYTETQQIIGMPRQLELVAEIRY